MDDQSESVAAGIEAFVREAVDVLIPIVEAIGAVIVFAGAVIAFVLWVLSQLGLRETPYDRIRLTLGRYLALGLE